MVTLPRIDFLFPEKKFMERLPLLDLKDAIEDAIDLDEFTDGESFLFALFIFLDLGEGGVTKVVLEFGFDFVAVTSLLFFD
mmetsp:Transcript_10559/g.14826  ORF Transcript_10559/g.14826 Transcript_10559/m.14826 type:complete len:81 (+) Transcript_10559:605-847(+)